MCIYVCKWIIGSSTGGKAAGMCVCVCVCVCVCMGVCVCKCMLQVLCRSVVQCFLRVCTCGTCVVRA